MNIDYEKQNIQMCSLYKQQKSIIEIIFFKHKV